MSGAAQDTPTQPDAQTLAEPAPAGWRMVPAARSWMVRIERDARLFAEIARPVLGHDHRCGPADFELALQLFGWPESAVDPALRTERVGTFIHHLTHARLESFAEGYQSGLARARLDADQGVNPAFVSLRAQVMLMLPLRDLLQDHACPWLVGLVRPGKRARSRAVFVHPRNVDGLALAGMRECAARLGLQPGPRDACGRRHAHILLVAPTLSIGCDDVVLDQDLYLSAMLACEDPRSVDALNVRNP